MAGRAVDAVHYQTQVSVEVSGVTAGATVRIEASMESWSSFAEFEASDDGTVSTRRDRPARGSYDEADPDGLFWSMTSATGEFASSADVAFRVVVDGEERATATLLRPTEIDGATFVNPVGASFLGTLVVPEAETPPPVILAFGGSEGGGSGGLSYAQELVPQGYAVLALAYFGLPGLPEELDRVPLEYFDEAVSWLQTRSEVDATRWGLAGGSRGGELALLLSARYPDAQVVIADVPSGYVWGGLGSGAAWTREGSPVPCRKNAEDSGLLPLTLHPTVPSPRELGGRNGRRVRLERMGATNPGGGGDPRPPPVEPAPGPSEHHLPHRLRLRERDDGGRR